MPCVSSIDWVCGLGILHVVEKERLDKLLVARGLVSTRSLAQRLIAAGEVRVNGALADKAGTKVSVSARIELTAKPRFVSRGGKKLAAALERFEIDVTGRIVADVGASTGGFTDCLLQYGAERVYAIDVGYGQLAWRLRKDPRVVVMERTNARYLNSLPEPVDMIVSDVSFISLRLIYRTAVRWLKPQGEIVSLIKPQFEAGRECVGRGGVVRDSAVHQRVLEEVVQAMAALGLGLKGLMVSPLVGPAGNVEFLGWWRSQPESVSKAPEDWQTWIAKALDEAKALLSQRKARGAV